MREIRSTWSTIRVNDKYTFALIVICLVSLFLNIYGIWWGLPGIWHPDEDQVGIALSMGLHMDPTPPFLLRPSFQYYVQGVVLLPYYLFLKLSGGLSDILAGYAINQIPSYFIINVWLISRLASAVMGSLTVFLVYLIGKEIYNKNVGLISASFLACTMGFVNISHFATVDVPVTFWTVVSFFFFIKIINTGKMKYYLLGGLFAGLAASTKYPALLLILPLFISHVLSYEQKSSKNTSLSFSTFVKESFLKLIKIIFQRKILLGAFMMIVGFVLGSPYSVLDISTFKKNFISVGSLFQTRSDAGGAFAYIPSWITRMQNLMNAMGLLLFLICAVGMIYMIYKLIKKREENQTNKCSILFLSWVILFGIVIGGWEYTPMRYMMPIIPFLAIFGGKFMWDMINSGGIRKKIMSVILCIVLVYSFGYCLTADTMFVHDSRYAAGEWIENNIGENSTIEVYVGSTYLPRFPGWVRIISPPTWSHNKKEYIDFLESREERKTDYIVLTSLHYGSSLRNPEVNPPITKYYSDLIYNHTNYIIVAKFGPPINESISTPSSQIIRTIKGHPNPVFVNPTIVILKRKSYVGGPQYLVTQKFTK